ncbi:MAG: ImmA/IrrE family metallo-endopeptidase [Lachnospiraceae bacterium]|nr:ImmA/IrrE family metallo-endopeptidase [Lachnospiraceae bacterium]
METKKFNGERLKNARLFNGFTLTELADKTDISKQSISLYENNRNIPEYDRVRTMASVLGFPFDFFFQEDKFATLTETTYFRSLASATKKDRIAQSVKLEYVARMYEVLWNYIEFQSFVDPKVDFTGFDDVIESESDAAVAEIEAAAEKVRKVWNVGDGPIKDLQYLLENHGVLVTGFPSEAKEIDAFSQRTLVEGNAVYLIAVVLGQRPEGRIRFDMAHELGHIVLHPWSEDLESITKDEFKARERQANMFASAFLLPRETFGRDILQYPTDLKYYQFLKNKWKVSIQAMIYRTHQLKIISTNQYQYLMRQVSKNGWRTKEPDDVPFYLNESIFQGAIDLLYDNNILNAKTLMQEFRKYGITLYPSTIEQLLHLREGTLDYEEKIVPLFQLKKNRDEI